MLTRDGLVELYRELEPVTVLSVYVDAQQDDPAERRTWRVRLDHGLASCRQGLHDRADQHRFEAAWSRLEVRLREFGALVPDRGWVGFAAPEALHYAETVPVPVRDGVFWEKGLRAAPYLRVLKQQRPVLVALLDGQHCRVLRYLEGEIERVGEHHADALIGDLSDVGVGKRSTRSSGVRGETSTDHAHRALEVSSQRMLKSVVDALTDAAGSVGFVVIGGTPEMVARASGAVPKGMQPRVLGQPSLHMGMDDSEIVEIAEQSASALTIRHQERLLSEVFDTARARGRACVGRGSTIHALREMRVDTLLLSRGLIRDELDLADQCVGTAFSQGAATEELSGPPATRLDAEGEGMAARLRYTVPEKEAEG